MVHGGLTVVVPVWDDYVRWLSDCVESILRQRQEVDLEVLVVDNASSAPILLDDARLLRLEDRCSVGAARNAGLDAVTTEFVAFADADDLFPSGYFRFAVDRLRVRPGVVAVGMRPVALDDSTGIERPFAWPTDGAIKAARRSRRLLAVRGLLMEPSIVMSGSVFRAEALRQAGGYSDLSYGEDANLALLLPFLGDVELHYSPNRRYRIHSGSLARQTPERVVLEATYADARRRLLHHSQVPLWAKALLPWIRRYHNRRIQNALTGVEQRKVL
ncbi:glycosyltransferase family 2 protein [Kribbella turkmenica]|uniref:Glycosyltransferase family 2 protein n=1 Tax=Kribbella turkmenica TaxID=2530375 RepID=A0A4R4XBM9_9ACTN|nr:glycosyltransferase family 2 protein [Kribbella turkmenica]TDD28058.1 glycosyltransferase family 2 protein [Kribbella turkmenica]